MRSGEMLRELERLVVAAQSDARALSRALFREADRRQRVLAALRTLIEARADLAKAGYALVPLNPTEAMLNAAGWAGFRHARSDLLTFEDVWRAMVAASAEAADPT